MAGGTERANEESIHLGRKEGEFGGGRIITCVRSRRGGDLSKEDKEGERMMGRQGKKSSARKRDRSPFRFPVQGEDKVIGSNACKQRYLTCVNGRGKTGGEVVYGWASSRERSQRNSRASGESVGAMNLSQTPPGGRK